jgi:predicted glycogen debranching enzyme
MNGFDLSTLRFDGLIGREWLATYGNGAYASSTLCSLNTRKYHGLLVGAMAAPARRMVLLSRVEETVLCGGKTYDLSCNEYPLTVHPQGHGYLRAFSHEPFPRWAYQYDGWTIEKQLRPICGQNTLLVSYTLLGGTNPIELELRPLFALRGIHELMDQWDGRLAPRNLNARQHAVPATSRTPEVFFAHDGHFSSRPSWYLNTLYRREQERGYEGMEDLWMPGVIHWKLLPGQTVHFVCSTDPIDFEGVLVEANRQLDAALAPLLLTRTDTALEALLRAADQFVVRGSDHAPAIIGAYPWLAAAGRDAMIALPGLLLVPGRLDEARQLLRSFVELLRDGVLPSEMSEHGADPLYHAADTSLWFIHAVGQYLRYRGDENFVAQELLPAIDQIINSYTHGTELGISQDEHGLLRSVAKGIPTTWMNAKVGDWMITPRQGRPVCLNALWYNALRIAADLAARFGDVGRSQELLLAADHTHDAFNRYFWNQQAGCCFDVVEDGGVDASIRPNQLLAVSLPYPVLETSRHPMVVQRVMAELATPVGVRTLSSLSPNYQGRYGGPVTARERAYHQGSAFPWLLGPLVTAFLRIHGHSEDARAQARRMLEGSLRYLQDEGTGQICELFDGDTPHRPGGAPASARSVAEVLRAYAEDVLDISPPPRQAPKIDLAPKCGRDPVENSR